MDDMTIRSLEGMVGIQPPSTILPQQEAKGPDFVDLLKGAVQQVNATQHESADLQDSVARGESMNIHQAVITSEKAGLSFQLMMQVRNKMLDAYQEVLRMQI